MSIEWREVVALAIHDLDGEHGPTWSTDDAKAKGKEPIGCRMCWPSDSHWPCTSSAVADDLRRLLAEGRP